MNVNAGTWHRAGHYDCNSPFRNSKRFLDLHEQGGLNKLCDFFFPDYFVFPGYLGCPASPDGPETLSCNHSSALSWARNLTGPPWNMPFKCLKNWGFPMKPELSRPTVRRTCCSSTRKQRNSVACKSLLQVPAVLPTFPGWLPHKPTCRCWACRSSQRLSRAWILSCPSSRCPAVCRLPLWRLAWPEPPTRACLPPRSWLCRTRRSSRHWLSFATNRPNRSWIIPTPVPKASTRIYCHENRCSWCRTARAHAGSSRLSPGYDLQFLRYLWSAIGGPGKNLLRPGQHASRAGSLSGRSGCRHLRVRTSAPVPHPGDRKQKAAASTSARSEEHTSELQSRPHLVCRLLLEKKKKKKKHQKGGMRNKIMKNIRAQV